MSAILTRSTVGMVLDAPAFLTCVDPQFAAYYAYMTTRVTGWTLKVAIGSSATQGAVNFGDMDRDRVSLTDAGLLYDTTITVYSAAGAQVIFGPADILLPDGGIWEWHADLVDEPGQEWSQIIVVGTAQFSGTQPDVNGIFRPDHNPMSIQRYYPYLPPIDDDIRYDGWEG